MSERKKPGPAKGDPRCRENGKKGGEAVKAKYGGDFFHQIGRSGGKQTLAKHGLDHYETIGKKGAQKRLAKGKE